MLSTLSAGSAALGQAVLRLARRMFAGASDIFDLKNNLGLCTHFHHHHHLRRL